MLLVCSKTTMGTLHLSRSQGLPEKVQEEEGGYTFFWSGRSEEEQRESGVCLAVKNCLAAKLPTLPAAISDQIQTLHIPLQRKHHITIINFYVPTLTNPSEVKEAFYNEVKTTISSVATSDKLMMLGDFNAWVGRECTVWPGVIRCQGVSTVTAMDYCSS